MSKSNAMQRLAATTAVALAFSPIAQANDSVSHPLQTSDARLYYVSSLYKTVEQSTLKATGSKTDSGLASLSARSLVVKFEAALAKPTDRPQMVWSVTSADLNGQPVPAGTIILGAVVPPKALYPIATTKNDAEYKGNPAVCAYVNDTILWKGVVNAFNGNVTTDNSVVATPAAGKSVCQPYLFAKGQEMMNQASSLQAVTPPVPFPENIVVK